MLFEEKHLKQRVCLFLSLFLFTHRLTTVPLLVTTHMTTLTQHVPSYLPLHLVVYPVEMLLHLFPVIHNVVLVS